MSHPWIKLWKADLLSSLNYQTLSVYEKGIYNQLLLLCRDEEYAGQFCWPNGNPLTPEEIVRGMHPKARERTDLIYLAIETLLQKGLIFWNKRKVLEIRKYAVKTEQAEQTEECTTTVQPLSDHCNPQTIKTKGVKNASQTQRKKKMKKNNKNSIYQSLFNYWNLQEIANHRKLTNKMKRCINGRLDEGFTEAELKQAMANYAKILKSEEYWWTHRWTALVDFLNRGIDKFKDWSVAHINYLKSDKKLASLKDKKEEQFEAGLHKIINECKKCDGKGSTPGENGAHECVCRKRVKELRKEHKEANNKAFKEGV